MLKKCRIQLLTFCLYVGTSTLLMLAVRCLSDVCLCNTYVANSTWHNGMKELRRRKKRKFKQKEDRLASVAGFSLLQESKTIFTSSFLRQMNVTKEE